MPGVIWIHPSRILVQSHQEDVLLLVGSVEREHAHHDEVGNGGTVKEHISPARPEKTGSKLPSSPEPLPSRTEARCPPSQAN